MGNNVACYFGFAKRAGKLTLGVNAVGTLRSCFLLVADTSVGKSSGKQIEAYRAKFACPLLYTEGLGRLVAREGCKLAAVREKHLAEAILTSLGGTASASSDRG